MNSISGFDGLQPTIEIIKYTKLIAIANKEVNYLWMEFN